MEKHHQHKEEWFMYKLPVVLKYWNGAQCLHRSIHYSTNALCTSIPLAILIYPNMFGGCVPGEIQATKLQVQSPAAKLKPKAPAVPCVEEVSAESSSSSNHFLGGSRSTPICIPW